MFPKPSISTKICSFFNMFRSFVAVGIFAIPYGFKLIGPALAVLYTLISGIFVYYGTNIFLFILCFTLIEPIIVFIK